MFPLCCSVRGCGLPLASRDANGESSLAPVGLFCERRHHFEQAKAGYWSLLQPQDKKSAQAGDSDTAVEARRRWLQRGHMQGLVDRIGELLSATSDAAGTEVSESTGLSGLTVELGCGEGTFSRAIFGSASPGSYCGVELSKKALRLAARNWPAATWVLANADRRLPFADHSIDRVVSLFGRRPYQEIVRVLADEGAAVVVVPGPEDLIELRQQAQEVGQRKSRWEAIAKQFSEVGLGLSSHVQWKQTVHLQDDALQDAMAMTYRAVRRSQQQRIEQLGAADVTLHAEILVFDKASHVPAA